MKRTLTTLILAAAFQLSAFATTVDIRNYQTETKEGNQGTDIQVYIVDSAASAFIIRLEFVNESNRLMRFSKLIPFDKQGQGYPVTVRAIFETGIGKVSRITVEELKATDFTTVAY